MSDYLIETHCHAYLDTYLEGQIQLTANGRVFTFADQAALNEFIEDQSKINVWEIVDRRAPNHNQTYFCRKNVYGELKKYGTKESLYKEISRDTNGAWELHTYQDGSEKAEQRFVLDNSGWFYSDFQEFDTRDAFLTAIDAKDSNQSVIQKLFWGAMTGAVVLGGAYAAYRYMSSDATNTAEDNTDGLISNDILSGRTLFEADGPEPVNLPSDYQHISTSSHLNKRTAAFEEFMFKKDLGLMWGTAVDSDNSIYFSTTGSTVTKLDSSGHLLFTKSISGVSSTGVIITPARNNEDYFLSGRISGNTSYITKLDSSSNLLWSKTYTYAPSAFFSITRLKEDIDNSIYISGFLTTDANESLLLKLDESGNILWSFKLGSGSYSRLDSFEIESGELVLGGSRLSTGRSAFVISVNKTTGSMIQSSKYSGTDNFHLASLTRLTDGRYAAAGHYTTDAAGGYDVNARPAVMIFTKHQDPDQFKSFGTEQGRFFNVKETRDGTALIVIGQKGTGAAADPLYAKLASNGDIIWSNLIGGAAHETNHLNIDSQGAILVGGYLIPPTEGYLIKFNPESTAGEIESCPYTGNSIPSFTATDQASVVQSNLIINATSLPSYASVTVSVSSFTPIISDVSSVKLSFDCSEIPPKLSSSNSGDVSFIEDQPPVAIDDNMVISDPDSLINSAEVAITNVFTGEDFLSIVNQNGITGIYYTGTGVLSLTGQANVTVYQTVMRNVTYENFSEDPNTATRTITFKVNDGNKDSNIISRDVTVTEVNDSPTLTGALNKTTFTENTPIVIEPGLIIGDDKNSIESALVKFNSTILSEDELTFTFQPGISGVYNSTSGKLTFTGSASKLDYQSVLRSVHYQSTSDNPSNTTRVLEFIVNDGLVNSNVVTSNITVIPVNDPPTLTKNSLVIIQGEAVNVTTADLSATDPDNDDMQLILTASNIQFGQFERVNNTAISITNFTQQEIVDTNIRFVHTGGTNAPAYQISVSDGSLSSTPSSASINFNAGYIPAITRNELTISQGQTTVLTTSQLEVVDPDTMPNALNITASSITHGQFNRVSSPTVSITLFTYQEVSSSGIQFRHDNSEIAPTYRLSVSDGVQTTSVIPATITFVNVNGQPQITGSVGTATFNENTPIVIEPGLFVNDDENTIASTLVKFTSFIASEDQLTFTFQPGISGSYNSTSGELTFSGVATPSDYQSVLRSVRYENSSENPANTARIVTFTVNDGIVNSNVVTSTITVIPINDSPVLTKNALEIIQGLAVVLQTTDLSATDPDNDDMQLIYTVSNLQFGQFERINNIAIPIASFTQQEVVNAGIRFVHTGGNSAPAYQISVSDGSLSTTPSSASINFNGGYTPAITKNELIIHQGQAVVLNTSYVEVVDPDTSPASLMITASSITHGQFSLTSNSTVSIGNFTYQAVLSNDVQFRHDDTEIAPTYRLSVSDGIQSTSVIPSTIAYINVNDAPVVVNPIADRTSEAVNVDFSFQFAADTFEDKDRDTLTYAAKIDGNTSLPSWVTFDGNKRQFSGKPENPGRTRFTVFATDPSNATGVANFTMQVAEAEENQAKEDNTGKTAAEEARLYGQIAVGVGSGGAALGGVMFGIFKCAQRHPKKYPLATRVYIHLGLQPIFKYGTAEGCAFSDAIERIKNALNDEGLTLFDIDGQKKKQKYDKVVKSKQKKLDKKPELKKQFDKATNLEAKFDRAAKLIADAIKHYSKSYEEDTYLCGRKKGYVINPAELNGNILIDIAKMVVSQMPASDVGTLSTSTSSQRLWASSIDESSSSAANDSVASPGNVQVGADVEAPDPSEAGPSHDNAVEMSAL